MASNNESGFKNGFRFTALATTFCVCLIASNIFEAKIFTLGPLSLTGGFLVFPISYIINDILSEVYGYKNTRSVIFLAFGLNALFVLGSQLVRILPEIDYGTAQEHFDFFFATDARISLASMAAFLCGSILNSKVMTAMKIWSIQKTGIGTGTGTETGTGGNPKQGLVKGFGWRAVLSSIIGESADSLVFFPIAFWGIGAKNIITLMLTQIVLKTLYEIIVLPITYLLVKRM